MAPTIFSWNKLLTYRESGEKLPGEYAADEQGSPTSDPNLARSLLPIGTYKGYGLAAMGEILCGVLTGMLLGALFLQCLLPQWINRDTLVNFIWCGRYLSTVVRI